MKKIMLLIIIILFLLNSVNASDIKLTDGRIVSIPDEYNITYQDLGEKELQKGLAVVFTDECNIMFAPAVFDHVSYEDKLAFVPVGWETTYVKEFDIDNKNVTEIFSEPWNEEDVPLDYVFVDKSNETVQLIVGIHDLENWDIEKRNNTIHNIIENMEF